MNYTRLFWRIFLPFFVPLVLISIALTLLLLSPQIRSFHIVLAVALVMLAASSGIWYARRLTGSLTQIITGVERMVQVDGGPSAGRDTIDDLDALAAAISKAANRLREHSGELEQKREVHDTIISSMIEGVLVVDAEERLVSINPAAARLLAVESSSAVGRTLQEAIRNSELQRLVARTLQLGASAEADVTLSGTEERYLQVTSTILAGEARDKAGALIVLNDVTRLRKLEQVRRDFVANVSHELKTPITSIKGYVETLLDGAFRDLDDAERFLNIIARQSNRLNSIIEDLLKLSRIEQGVERGEIALEKSSLKSLLSAAITACETSTRAKNITVSLSCPDNLVARINPPLLEQAVINLIDNAAKYSPAGSAIDVTATQTADTIAISVRDNGTGIAPEHLPRLFERFYRVDKARSRSEGGTGLGLAITKHIVLAHGGTISVNSRVGEGSTFIINLICG